MILRRNYARIRFLYQPNLIGTYKGPLRKDGKRAFFQCLTVTLIVCAVGVCTHFGGSLHTLFLCPGGSLHTLWWEFAHTAGARVGSGIGGFDQGRTAMRAFKRGSLIDRVLGGRNARWCGWGMHACRSVVSTCTPAGVVALIESCSGLRAPLLDNWPWSDPARLPSLIVLWALECLSHIRAGSS